MAYWLLKSEPSTFGIEHLAKSPRQTTAWEGVRNYQARNFLRDDIKRGDLAFFYHSSCPVPAIVGVVKVVKEAYPDPTAFDPRSPYYDPKATPKEPRWFVVDVTLVKQYKSPIPLSQLRQMASLNNMKLLQRGSRLSITPVTPKEWQAIEASSK